MMNVKAISLFSVLLAVTGSAVAKSKAGSGYQVEQGSSYQVSDVVRYETHQRKSHQPNPDRGAYAGIGFGSTHSSVRGAKETFEDKNLRAYLGYDLNRYFAVEAGYGSIPFDEYLGDVGDLTGIDVSVLAKLPVTAKLSGYARLGYWDWDFSRSANGKKHDSFGGTDMLYGIGLDYKVSPRFKLRLDATRYEAKHDEFDAINASIAYKW